MKHTNKIKLSLIGLIAIALLNSCSMSYSNMMKKGEIQDTDFNVTTNFEKYLGLVIVPVEINGKIYRFLFDTGATTCISMELDKELDKKTIYRGSLLDSDNNKTSTKYILLDSLIVGGVSFYDQSCFVTDLNKNPILKCMNLDGILGSNTMRYCNWSIDYETQKIKLTNEAIDTINKYAIPFGTDRQYNIKINLKLGELKISNLKIDYGSNGGVSLPKSVINELVDKKAMTKITSQTGFSQSGITGKISKIEDLNGQLDSLYYKGLSFKNIPIRTGKGLIGGKLLSNWIVDIDWDRQKLYFTQQKQQKDHTLTFGMFINYSQKRGAYIQSVVQNSDADKKGVVPEMSVLKVDNIELKDENDFCKYISQDKDRKQIALEILDLNGDTLQIQLNETQIDY